MDLNKGPGGDDRGGIQAPPFKQKDSNKSNEKKGGSWGRGGGLQMEITSRDGLGSAKGNVELRRADKTTLSNERGEDRKVDGNSKKEPVTYGSDELKRLALEYKE